MRSMSLRRAFSSAHPPARKRMPRPIRPATGHLVVDVTEVKPAYRDGEAYDSQVD